MSLQRLSLYTWLKRNIFFVLISVLFLIGSLLFILPSGWHRCNESGCGTYMAGWHMHDALWHISVAEVALKTMPPQHPLFADAKLIGYNLVFDILLKVTALIGISPVHGFFHVWPVVIALFYIYMVWYVTKHWYVDRITQWSVMFFLLLGNSAAFLMTLSSGDGLVDASTRGFPLVLSVQPLTMFYNLQYALSLGLLLLYMRSIETYDKKILKVTIMQVVLFGTLFGLKIYAGFTAIVYFTIYSFVTCLRGKYAWRMFAFQLGAHALMGIIILVSIYGLGSTASSQQVFVFVWDPMAYIRSLIDDPNHFFVRNIALARVYLEETGRFSPRLLAIYSVGIIGFVVVNFGTRLIGLLYLFVSRRDSKLGDLSPRHIAIALYALISLLIPLGFVQRGDWFNTMQFLYYGVFLSSIPAGIMLAKIIRGKKYVFIVLTISITLIPYVDILRYPFIKQNLISQSFLSATSILRKLPDGPVLILGVMPLDSRVPAFTGKQAWLADIPVIRNTNVDRIELDRRIENLENPYTLLNRGSLIRYVFIDTHNVDMNKWNTNIRTLPFEKIISVNPYEVWSRKIRHDR